MTAQLNTLIDRGRELRANEEAQQAEHERQAQLAKEEEVRLWLTRLAQDLGISAEDFQALSPQFDPYQYGKGGEIELHWRGQKVTVNCEAITRIGEGKNYQFKWSGLAQGDLKEHLAEWLFNAEETYTERKRDALAGMVKKFRYLKVALALILMVVGVKMLLAEWLKLALGKHFNVYLLMAVLAILAAGVAASLLADHRSAKRPTSR